MKLFDKFRNSSTKDKKVREDTTSPGWDAIFMLDM